MRVNRMFLANFLEEQTSGALSMKGNYDCVTLFHMLNFVAVFDTGLNTIAMYNHSEFSLSIDEHFCCLFRKALHQYRVVYCKTFYNLYHNKFHRLHDILQISESLFTCKAICVKNPDIFSVV